MLRPAQDEIGRVAAHTITLLLICTALLTAACASAGRSWSGLLQSSGPRRPVASPGSWERVETLREGSRLIITLKIGSLVEGPFKALGPELVVLTDSAGREFSV